MTLRSLRSWPIIFLIKAIYRPLRQALARCRRECQQPKSAEVNHMKRILLLPALLVAIALTPMSAEAHCNATDGPVATAAVKALDTRTSILFCPMRRLKLSRS